MTWRAAATLATLALGPLLARGDGFYQERWRPQFHFTPPSNWMNDPNGLVYDQGHYHLFYQFNPEGEVWGHMSWGHAVSPDLVHWTLEPLALREAGSIMAFSGCAVVDARNSSGFGPKGRPPPIVAIYTAHHTDRPLQTQDLAYSVDRGRTWSGYAGNPVLDIGDAEFRDPKAFWFEAGRRWEMVVAWPQHHEVRFYTSQDLKHWVHQGDFGPAGAVDGAWECPDLFPLPVEGAGGKRKWVLIVNINPGAPLGGSGCQYFVGDFDGTRFIEDVAATGRGGGALWADGAWDFYAASSWNDVPAGDGRRLWIGWMSNWQYGQKVPTSPWRSAMTLPRSLSLRATPAGLRLIQRPVREVQRLRSPVIPNGPRGPYEYEWDWSVTADALFDVALRSTPDEGLVLHFDLKAGQVTLDRTRSGAVGFDPAFAATATAPVRAIGGHLKLQLWIDSSSLEAFINDGETVLTSLYFPSTPEHAVQLTSVVGQVRMERAEAWPLHSIWSGGRSGLSP